MSADNYIVAKAYAQSLFSIAQVEETVEILENEFYQLKELLMQNQELKDFLNNPSVNIEGKKKAIKDIFKGGISSVFLNQLNLIVDFGRQKILPEIIEEFLLLSNAARGKVVAYISTAVPLPDELGVRLKKELSMIAGKEVVLRTSLDEKLIGGILVRVGEKVIDGSIRYKLEKLRKELITTS